MLYVTIHTVTITSVTITLRLLYYYLITTNTGLVRKHHCVHELERQRVPECLEHFLGFRVTESEQDLDHRFASFGRDLVLDWGHQMICTQSTGVPWSLIDNASQSNFHPSGHLRMVV